MRPKCCERDRLAHPQVEMGENESQAGTPSLQGQGGPLPCECGREGLTALSPRPGGQVGGEGGAQGGPAGRGRGGRAWERHCV